MYPATDLGHVPRAPPASGVLEPHDSSSKAAGDVFGHDAVEESLPGAQIAYDHFHIAKLANEALNEVRREFVRSVRGTDPTAAKEIKSMRWPTLYRMDHVPEKHTDSLALLRPDQPLGRAGICTNSATATSVATARSKGWTRTLPSPMMNRLRSIAARSAMRCVT